jgi:DoxX-like family
MPLIGELAAACLVLFFLGAIAFHVRARVFHNIAAPGAFLLFAVASLVLAIEH